MLLKHELKFISINFNSKLETRQKKLYKGLTAKSLSEENKTSKNYSSGRYELLV